MIKRIVDFIQASTFLWFVVLVACGGSQMDSCTRNLSLDKPNGPNDDPSLVKASDGTYHLAFISKRPDNMDIWIAHSTDGKEWSSPIKAAGGSTTDELYPMLLEDDSTSSTITFHLSYTRFQLASPFAATIIYRKVTYKIQDHAYSFGPEIQVTSGLVDDRDPQMIRVSSNDLRIFFSSSVRTSHAPQNRDLYMVRSSTGGTTWGTPAPVKTSSGASVSSSTEYDRYPWVAQTSSDKFYLVFQRQITDDLQDPTSDLFVSTSDDGLSGSWSNLSALTHDNDDAVYDLYPSIQWVPSRQKWYIAWSSTLYPLAGKAGILGLPIGQLTQTPSPLENFSDMVGRGGWSIRVAEGNSSEKSFMVFVSDDDSTLPKLFSARDDE